jgi:spore protease
MIQKKKMEVVCMAFVGRSDLAVETREMVQKGSQREIPGVEVNNENIENIAITRVKIKNDEGSKTMGKPIGSYITLDIPELNQNIKEINDKTVNALADEIKKICRLSERSTVLVVGLGNWNITPDALGPKVVSRIAVTRHLIEYAPEYIDKDARPVCVLAPGVLGITGIETGDVIKGVVEKIKPDLVIAIDALASRRMERISTTIQIADTGINPGSGVGNKRMQLNYVTLGVPVLAIGVPTVVDAVTMANDALELMVDTITKQAEEGTEFYQMLKNMQQGDKYDLIKEILSPYVGDLVVTPKEIDSIISNVSGVVADAINVAMHGTLENAEKYLN